MGAGQSDLYKGTYGDNPDNIPDALKGSVKLPDGEAQLKHIFGNRKGHFPDTQENRQKVLYHLGKMLSNISDRDYDGNHMEKVTISM